MNLITKIALGIVLAFMIMATAAAYIKYQTTQEINEAIRKQDILEQERVNRELEAELQLQERQRLLAIKEKQEKAALLLKEARRLAIKKKQDWQNWYNKKNPKDCNDLQSDRHMVECINTKMELKSEFELVWNSQIQSAKK